MPRIVLMLVFGFKPRVSFPFKTLDSINGRILSSASITRLSLSPMVISAWPLPLTRTLVKPLTSRVAEMTLPEPTTALAPPNEICTRLQAVTDKARMAKRNSDTKGVIPASVPSRWAMSFLDMVHSPFFYKKAVGFRLTLL